MKILFLDVDGILNSEDYALQFFLFSHAGVQDEWISSNNLIDGFDVNKTDALTRSL